MKKYKLASQSTGGADTRTAGIGILVALTALAGFAYLFGFGRRGVKRLSS